MDFEYEERSPYKIALAAGFPILNYSMYFHNVVNNLNYTDPNALKSKVTYNQFFGN